MKKELSVYLDLLRLGAALLVFASHMTFAQFTGGIVPYQGDWAAAGVAAFFVLSGYVISYVADRKERALGTYAVSRMARIYSVALPALALTIGVDLLSLHLGWPRPVPVYQYRSFAKYLIAALTFCDQAGPLHEPTFGNGVFWSLDYEVWYYLIFAAAHYYTGIRRAVLVPLLVVLSGPRIAILLPMWWMGVLIYRFHCRHTIPKRLALSIFIVSIAALLATRVSGADVLLRSRVSLLLGGWPQHYLSNSQNFVSDYIVAGFIALNILAANYIPLRAFSNRRVQIWISYFASFTFALYLMHRPLIDLFRFGLPYDPHSALSWTLLVAAVLFSVWVLGFVTEHRKFWWRRIFEMLVGQIRAVLSTRLPRVYRLIAAAPP